MLKVKKSVEQILKKDDVLILEEYKHIGGFEERVSLLTKKSESVQGEVSALNSEFLQQEMKELNEGVGHVRVNLKKEELGHAMNVRQGQGGGS